MARARWATAVWAALPAGALLSPALEAREGLAAGAAVVAIVAIVAIGLAYGPRSGLLAALCLASTASGIALERRERRAWESVADSWLPDPGVSRELHFSGRLLEPPTVESSGEWLLRLEGLASVTEAVLPRDLHVRLRVAASSSASSGALARMRAGEAVRVWCSVWRPRGLGEPGQADPVALLRAQGLDAIGAVKNAALVEQLAPARPGPRAWAGRLKQLARLRLDRILGEQNRDRALAGAMLLGDRAGLSPGDVRVLRDSGLAHLVAISGLHVGLLIALAHGALTRLRLPAPLRWAVTVVAMSGFALVVGPVPSVLRAVIGAGIVLFGRTLGREGRGLHGLTVVAAVLVTIRPALVLDAGFQLTFVATAALLVAAARGASSGSMTAAARISAAAYVATAPVLALQFGRLAPVGLLANLVAVPLSVAVLFAALACVVFADLPGLSEVSSRLCEATSRALWVVADRSAAWEPGSFAVAPVGIFVVLGFFATAILALSCGRPGRLVAGSTAALLFVMIHLGPCPDRAVHDEAVLLDVGQGLAVALRGAAGTALIDAGGSFSPGFDPGERVVVPHLLRWGRHLDVLALTHDHFDHVGGAFAVLRAIDVSELWLGPGSAASKRLAALADLARSQGTAVVFAARGLHAEGGLSLQVLAPASTDRDLVDNDRSLVLRAGQTGARLLVTGDLEQRGERALLEAGAPVGAEALVVGHHGSASSSSSHFLSCVGAEWGLISAGFGNRFGHPDPAVVRRLERGGARVLRTDLQGRIHLHAGPDGWQVESYR